MVITLGRGGVFIFFLWMYRKIKDVELARRQCEKMKNYLFYGLVLSFVNLISVNLNETSECID